MDQATAITQARYDRLAPFYDLMEGFMERSFFGKLRYELWSRISADNILEVGVGKGENIMIRLAVLGSTTFLGARQVPDWR